MPFAIQDVRDEVIFKNDHGNYREKFAWLIRLFNDEIKEGLDMYRSTSDDVRAIITKAIEKNMPLRACGSLWSLSKAPYVRGAHIFSVNEMDDEDLKFKMFLKAEHLSDPSDEQEHILFAQCGNLIKDLSAFSEKEGRSLMTSGASNGQTIAGAIGTGVHGSSINVGSIQDTVVGLHIIKGTSPEDSIYIERASVPIVSNSFVGSIGATLVRDDDLFEAALVSLGAFGYVHGVAMRTRKLYMLSNFIRKVDISDAYRYLQTSSIVGTPMDIPGLDPEWLFHIKFYINQYRQKDNVRAEIIYDLSDDVRTDLETLAQPEFLKYNKDFLLEFAKLIAAIADELIPKKIDKQLPTDGEKEIGLLSEIFGDTTNMRDGQFACAVAVNVSRTEELVKLMMKPFESKKQKKIPSVFSFRFVPKSKALMAFTKYPMNCIIGIDGIDTRSTRKYLKRITRAMFDSGIPHTWHWGKINYMDRDFVVKMYGDDWRKWHEQKKKFLSPEVAQLFSSKYLRNRGL